MARVIGLVLFSAIVVGAEAEDVFVRVSTEDVANLGSYGSKPYYAKACSGPQDSAMGLYRSAQWSVQIYFESYWKGEIPRSQPLLS